MAKIAVLNHHPIMARMFARPLEEAGHEVLTATPPFDVENLVDFGPRAIVVVLDRRVCAAARPVEDPERDLYGFEAIEALEAYPALQLIPILVIGNAVPEGEIATSTRYDVYLGLPDELDRYVETVACLIDKVKSRRRLSGYLCPICGGRMTYSRQPARDLFCPRCYTSVNLVEGEEALVVPRGTGRAVRCAVHLFERVSPCPTVADPL
jgi:CheY-like chemotaxis protein